MIKNLNDIRSLQPITCNSSMQRVFDYIRGKTLDSSGLQFSSQIPEVTIVHGWYKDNASNPVYLDNRTSTTYIVGMYINGDVTSCNKNPVENCLCIITLSWDMIPSHQATATATVVGGEVTSINVTNPGLNYTEVPDIIISGVGTGATATATVSTDGLGTITGITVTNSGSGYVQSSTVVMVYFPLSFTVPDSVIDEAMSSLPTKSNILLYAALATVGIGVIYLATRK